MSDFFVGEIRAFGCNFAPKDWALCNGATLQIAQNQALCSLIGTQFGGNGTTTFALPDLRSRTPVPVVGLAANRIATGVQGTTGGAEVVTLTTAQMPTHTHAVVGTSTPGTAAAPANSDNSAHYYPATPVKGSILPSTLPIYVQVTSPTTANKSLHPATLDTAGGSQPHANRQPYIALNFCIAMVGLYPQRP
jgi:microcystin-dependent protein